MKSKVVVISGGIGGLGKATAREFASQGATVQILDNQDVKLENFFGNTTGCEDTYTCDFYKADITNQSEINDAIDTILMRYQKIDILVNCAGIARGPGQRREDGTWLPMEEVSLDDWDRVITINLTGTFLLCKAVAKSMINQRWGRVINTASISGLIANRGLDGLGPYAASKGGVISLTKVLAVEWAKYGITVNSISPGYMATEMGMRSQSLKGFKELQLSLIPQGRLGEPEEFAKAVLFLASDGAAHITGHNLIIDGGYTAW